MEHSTLACLLAALTLAYAVPSSVQAQGASAASSGDAQTLAKQLTNPVADLVSIPLQFNWEQGVGVNDDLRTVMNFQPVVPFSLTPELNLIGRMILPYVNQPSLIPGASAVSGTGDVLLSGFLSPARAGGPIWGIGPALSLPTTTDPFLGTGKWSIGPTVVVLQQSGQWTYGALVNHLWSVADTGDIDRNDVDQSFLQPFVAFTTRTAMTFTVSSESSANWEAASGEKWTVPILVSMSKVTRLGPFPFSLGAGVGIYVERPSGGPDWKLRGTATLILPRAR